jgi:hypothetical protein
MQPLSKGFYLGSIIGGLAVGLVLIFGVAVVAGAPGDTLDHPRDPDTASAMLGLMCVGLIPILYAAIVQLRLLYKLWAAIQDGNARTSPGLAVGLLFIPCWNVYWIFQAYWGWAVDYNRYVESHRISAPRVSEGLALTFCILQLVGVVGRVVPLVSGVVGLLNLVLLLVFLSSAIDGVNAIGAAPAGGYGGRGYDDDRWPDARSKFADRQREDEPGREDRYEDRGGDDRGSYQE